jgi:hypothetical protein
VVPLSNPCDELGSMACTVPVIDESPIELPLKNPCDELGSMACTVPVIDESPIELPLKNPCDELGSTACTVPTNDESPIELPLQNPCDLVGSTICQVPGADPSPITIAPQNPCTELLAVCEVPPIDLPPTTVVLDDPCAEAVTCQVPVVDPPPIVVAPTPCATQTPALEEISQGKTGRLACGILGAPPLPEPVCPVTSASQTGAAAGALSLGLKVENGLLHWNAVDADCYRLVDPYEKLFVTTTETTFPHPALLSGDNFSLTVAAIRDNAVVGIERLRGSTIALNVNGPVPSVQGGMELLSAMFVRTTPTAVEFQLPEALLGVVDGWNLYRDETLVGTAGVGQRIITDKNPGPTLSSVTYSIQLLGGQWVTPYEEGIGWVSAVEETCIDETDGECNSPLGSSTVDSAEGLEQDPEFEAVESVSGHLLTLALPIEIPAMQDPGSAASIQAAGGYYTSPRLDDGVVHHRTFIEQDFVNPPECFFCTDYRFAGDHRGFSNTLDASTRTRVTLRMDWEGESPFYKRAVSPTKRYIAHADGSLEYESTKTGFNNPTVQYIAHNRSRYRFRVRHSAKNPYQGYFPAIDYEWEYVMVRDGGITTKGLHDGAPNYEDFYRAPFSEGSMRVYSHTYTNEDFKSLAFPMDQKDRGWCRSGCPSFGTARWV